MRSVSYRRRRRRKQSKTAVFLTLLLTAVLLVSCTAGSNAGWFRRLIGADLADYQRESVIASPAADGEIARTLSETVRLLTSGSVNMKEFHSASRAVALYRDEILSSLMSDRYSTYVGNSSLLPTVRESYPRLNASVLIPQADFETAVSRHLGLSSASNRSGALFTYLSKTACYITPLQVKNDTVSISVSSLEETEHTYRLGFTLTDPSGQSASYTALFVKRDDGGAFLRALAGA